MAYRFCPSATPTSSGTFTNATQLIIARYSGVHGLGNAPGKSNATGTSISYPAPASAVQSSGHSWYVGVGGHRTASNVGTAPSGMTNRYTVGTGPMAALHDTNGGVASWTTASATVNTSSGHESMVWELLADEGAWSALNSSGTATWTLSTNNRVAQTSTSPANTNCIRTFTSHSTGKWYFLGRLQAYGSTNDLVTGLCTGTTSMTVWPGGANNNGIGFGFNSAGTDNQWINHTATNNSSIYNHPAAVNDFFHFAWDLTNGLCWVKHDSMTDWNNDPTASPDSGTGGFAYTDVLGSDLFPFTGSGNNASTFAINTQDVSSRPSDASTFTGWDNVASSNTNITVPLGTATLTGLAPTMTQAMFLVPGAVSLSLTGFASTVTLGSGISITVPAGSASLSGLAATLNTNVAMPVGSLSLTGQAPTKVVNNPITMPAGALSLSGFAPALVSNNIITVPAGSLILTGFTVGESWNVSVPLGSITLSGIAPSVTLGTNIPVPAGSLSLSGLVVGTSWNVAVPKGSIALSGFAPSLVNNNIITVPAGSLSLSGFVPLFNSNVSVPAGSLTLNGLAPSAGGQGQISPSQGVLTLSGLVPGLSWNVAVPAGSLAISGKAPALVQDTPRTIPAGSLSLVGLSPSLNQNTGLNIPAGSLTLSGKAGTLAAGITPPAGSLAITGNTLTQSTNVQVPKGAATLQGYAPTATVFSGFNISVPAGAISFTEYAPVLTTGYFIIIGVGSLSLTGYAPTIKVHASLIASPDYIVVCDAPEPIYAEDLDSESTVTGDDQNHFITG